MRRVSSISVTLVIIGLCSCGADENEGRGPRQRVPLGKADGSNSCVGLCGDQASGGCYCDDQCEGFGDCCPDKKDVCDGVPASCDGFCGGQSADGCWCDELCAHYGDCCGDRDDVCAAPGCADDSECPAGEKCNKDEDDPQASGECVPETQCETVMDCMSLTVQSRCDGAWRCVESQCQFECGHEIPACHVGGCSGQLCTPLEGISTSCDYLDWYECFQYTSCGNYTPDGSCSWKGSEAYVDCLASYGVDPCDLEADPTKSYVLKDAEQCKVAKFSCLQGQPFFDQCGCGCVGE